MDSRPTGYFADTVALPIPTGSEYVSKLIRVNTANVITSALQEAQAMMQAAVTSDGYVNDVDALTEAEKCMEIAITHYKLFRGM